MGKDLRHISKQQNEAMSGKTVQLQQVQPAKALITCDRCAASHLSLREEHGRKQHRDSDHVDQCGEADPWQQGCVASPGVKVVALHTGLCR